MRIKFEQLFRQYPDGGIEPIRRIRVGGVEFGPGVRFSGGVSFSGIDLTRFIGKDFEVEDQNGVLFLKGVYE